MCMLQRVRELIDASAPVRVVLYGDSICEVGRTPNWCGGATAPERNWGPQLVRLLNEAYPHVAFGVYHFGIGGQNTYEGLSRIDDLEAFKPDLVLVAFGANDCGYHFLEPEETGSALARLSKSIHNRTGADVVLVGTAGDNPQHPSFRHLDETLAVQQHVAEAASLPFVDQRSAMLEVTQNGACWADYHINEENCHPTDRGHVVWARTAYAVIEEALK